MQAALNDLDSQPVDAHIVLQATLDALDTGVAAINDAGAILIYNQRFFSMLARAGLLAPEHASTEVDRLSAMPIAETAPGLTGRPAEVRGPGGRMFAISYKMDPAGIHGTLIQLRDVTSQHIDAGAVDDARIKGDMIEHARNAFISQVAHHFRTPLHVILGYVDILTDSEQDKLDKLTRNSYLGFIREAAAALLLNMNEMMEIIRLQRAELEVELEPCDLGMLLSTVMEEVQPDIDAEQSVLQSASATAMLAGVQSLLDVRLARRGLNSLLRTSAVLGGQGCKLDLSAKVPGPNGAAQLILAFETGRASPEDVVASVENQEPVKEISLTGRASGYGIVLAVLLLRKCKAHVSVRRVAKSEVIIEVLFA